MYRQHIGWKFGIVAGLAVVVITLIPQIIVCIDRGRDWQGSYAFTDPDELAYSAYLNSIIEGRPRRNNPYLGTKESPATAAGENFYSIQFLPSYGLALLAQLSGLSASTVFILLVPVMAFASSMTVFWLISDVTGDDKLAALGTMIILLSGVMVSESPFVSENAYGGYPFLRLLMPGGAVGHCASRRAGPCGNVHREFWSSGGDRIGSLFLYACTSDRDNGPSTRVTLNTCPRPFSLH